MVNCVHFGYASTPTKLGKTVFTDSYSIQKCQQVVGTALEKYPTEG